MSKLTLEQWNNLNIVMKELKLLNAAVNKRVDYIIKKIVSIFNMKLEWWGYSETDEGEAQLKDALYQDSVCCYISYKRDKGIHNQEIIIDTNGKELVLLSNGFPVRWLYEDFEDELIQGKEKYKAVIEQKKQAEKLKQTATKELAKQAKAKLNDEELKALVKEYRR